MLVLIWSDDWGSEEVARAFGCFAVAGLRRCARLRDARRRQREATATAIQRLTRASLALAAIDTVGVILPIIGLVDRRRRGRRRGLFGASLVLLVLTTVLPPILRRTQIAAPAPVQSNGHGPEGDEFLAGAVVRIADRIDALNRDPGNRAPEIRAELDRLRKLAQSFEN